MDDFDPESSIIGQMKPVVWDQEKAVAFEVAREVIGDVIGAISGIVYHEERREHPDTALTEALSAERKQAANDQRSLTYEDRELIRTTTRQYADRLKELDVLLQARIAER